MFQNRACDVAVIGAGPAGLAAAIAAKKAGAERVLIIERDTHPGGILQQCIHPGFGLSYFGKELTGPEYAYLFEKQAEEQGIEIMLDTMVLNLTDRHIAATSPRGMIEVEASAVVLAMGCRERTRGAIRIPGTRAAGIYTAGTAQRLLNMQGELVGKKIVILGSGDIGMIMARRMTLEGAKVETVVEVLPYLAGLTRNKVQCLDDFNIPLRLSHTVIDITGVDRVESVTISKVDDRRDPIPGTEEVIVCDTLLLSVGLIPENEISFAAGVRLSPITKGPVVDQYMQTSVPGIFACGNVLHVNDLVDNVTRESERAGKNAALYTAGKLPKTASVDVVAGTGVTYVCPQKVLCGKDDAVLFFRVRNPMKDIALTARCGDEVILRQKKARVSPGEMEKLILSKEKLELASGPIIVCVEEE